MDERWLLAYCGHCNAVLRVAREIYNISLTPSRLVGLVDCVIDCSSCGASNPVPVGIRYEENFFYAQHDEIEDG